MTAAFQQVWILLACTVLLAGAMLWSGAQAHEVQPGEPGARSLRIGESIQSVPVLVGDRQEIRLPLTGRWQATVIWYWSALCPCIPDCEARLQALQTRYQDLGVRLLAIDPNPQDTAADIQELRTELGSTYPVYRDPYGFTVRVFGIEASASVVVLDANGRLRYRGAIDDDLYKPTHSYVHAALDAILGETPVSPVEVPSYGCAYPR